LSSTGGLIGIALGFAGAQALTIIKNWPTLVSPTWAVIAFLTSAFIGIVSGFYPAWKASKLDPIDALRFE
jgi:putative ABC transport system permease protein